MTYGCGSCNQPSIYRSPTAPNANLRCKSDACGFNKSNDLGYILRDHAFSVITAQQIIQSDAGESGCPTEVEVCLRLPCDIVSGPEKWTTPLVLADGTPFFLRKGDIIQKIVVAKNNGNDLDPKTCFILGTLGCDCATSEPQRFIHCTYPLCGCVLNEVCAVKIRDTCLPVCTHDCPDECADQCQPSCQSTTTEVGEPTCLPEDANLCSGERSDSMIGITVLCGTLATYQIRIFVQYLSVKCSNVADICNPCF